MTASFKEARKSFIDGAAARGKPNCKLLIKPSRKNVKAHLTKVRESIRKLRTAKQANVIGTLNPIIRGWANFHRHIVAKETFNKTDHAAWKALWRWARRRHPMKPSKWVKTRYWPFEEVGRKWDFSCGIKQGNGEKEQVTLRRASAVAIERHVKIQGAANPYDPEFEVYFEQRAAERLLHSIEGRQQLISLWKRQNGLCPVCATKITKETGWHNHHLVRKIDGGSDAMSNRKLLRPTCHWQGHASKTGFAFVQPV